MHADMPSPDAALWSDDAFLDRLRASTDEEANATVAQLEAGDDLSAVNAWLRDLRALDQELPASAPAVFKDFFDQHRHACTICAIDPEIQRLGGDAFYRWAYPAAIVMLASSLPSGYSAPPLSRVLTVSDELAVHPYRRLLAVIQLLIDVSSPALDGADGLDRHDDAETAALKLRLLHAGVRSIVPRSRPAYIAKFGSPVNHEDMLATIMGFSLLVVDGLDTLGFPMRAEETEAYWLLWRYFARLMAIVPGGDFEDQSFLPETLDDARVFYRAYQRRWFCQRPEENPDGVHLTERNRQMMVDLVPGPLRLLGLGRAPDILMTDLLGEEGLRRLGMQPLVGHHADRAMLRAALKVGQDVSTIGHDFSSLFAARILGGMVQRGMGRVVFSVPDSVAALHRLAEPERFDPHAHKA